MSAKRQSTLLGTGISFLLLMFSSVVANGATIDFLCSWDKAAPITISVDRSKMKATRDDGGAAYTVVKITKWGIWLMVDQPTNIAAANFQMIQRGEAVTPYSKLNAASYSAGAWIDVILSISGKGAISPITGGICWEQKK